MKALALVSLLLLSCPGLAQAEGVPKGHVEFLGSLGGSLPVGAWGDAADAAFNLGGNIGLYMSPRYVFGAELNWNRFGTKDDLVALGNGEHLEVLQTAIYLKRLFTARSTSPYVKIGGGMYNYDWAGVVNSALVQVSDTDLGFSGGLGIQLKGTGPAGGFAEVLYHAVLRTSNNVLSERPTIGYFGVRVGMSITVFTGKRSL